jgi:predicted HicB family RNase H-like nuclease
MTTVNTVQLTVRIPADLKRKVNLCCAEQEIKIQEFICRAIENRLKAYQEQKEKK